MVAHPAADVLISVMTCGIAANGAGMAALLALRAADPAAKRSGHARHPDAVPRRSWLRGSFEHRPFGGGKALELSVEGLIRRAECVEERPPVPLVLPAVDRQEPAGPDSVAVQLSAHETRSPAKQLAPGAVGCVDRGERPCPVVWYLVLPHPHEHASIGPQPRPRRRA
jgi:hypothetical protein